MFVGKSVHLSEPLAGGWAQGKHPVTTVPSVVLPVGTAPASPDGRVPGPLTNAVSYQPFSAEASEFTQNQSLL